MNKILAISVTRVTTNNNNSDNNSCYHHHYHNHYPCLALTPKLLLTIQYELLESCDWNNTINTVLENMIEIYSL